MHGLRLSSPFAIYTAIKPQKKHLISSINSASDQLLKSNCFHALTLQNAVFETAKRFGVVDSCFGKFFSMIIHFNFRWNISNYVRWIECMCCNKVTKTQYEEEDDEERNASLFLFLAKKIRQKHECGRKFLNYTKHCGNNWLHGFRVRADHFHPERVLYSMIWNFCCDVILHKFDLNFAHR